MTAVPEVPVLRLSAFALNGEGGNPAGVVLDARDLSDDEMLRIAAEVGYSETVFVVDGPPVKDRRRYAVRYFSALAEVPFCGHATIALGAALAGELGAGDLLLETSVGPVSLNTGQGPDGRWWTRLASVAARQEPVDPAVLQQALACFGWSPQVLDPALPPMLSYAGAWHLILGLADRHTLETMTYDFDALQRLCLEHDWTTVTLAYQISPEEHLARNPFPVGGVLEDPATGAAAAAFGALGVLTPPARLRIQQGEQIGRPSELIVELPVGEASVWVTGVVTPIS